MVKHVISLALASSLALSLSAYANKGADYEDEHPSHHNNDLDWSKGWYIGAGVNGNAEATIGMQGQYDMFEPVGPLTLKDGGGTFETELTSSDVGFDVYIGRRVSKHWAVELGYTQLGDANFDFEVEGSSSTTEIAEITVEQWNAHLVGLGILPLAHHVNIFFKGGVAYFSSEQEYTPVISDSPELTNTLHTFSLTYGAGIELDFPHWGVRAEYNAIAPTESIEEDFYIADIISANIYYRFN